jgi:hypothetical protein
MSRASITPLRIRASLAVLKGTDAGYILLAAHGPPGRLLLDLK